MHDFAIASGALLASATALAGSDLLAQRTPIDQELGRKIGHALSWIASAAALYLVQSWEWMLVIGSIAAAGFVVIVETRALPGLLKGSRMRDYGLVASALTFGLLPFLFWPDRTVIAAAFLVLALGDSAAAVIGSRWGRHTVEAWGCRRSLEGGLALAVVAFPIALWALASVSGTVGVRELLLAVTVASVATAVEMLSPSAIDNLALTVAVAATLTLAAGVGPVPGAVSGSGMAMVWASGAVGGWLLGWISVRLGWLDRSAAVGAALLTTLVVALGGWTWFLPLAAFFVSGSVLTKLSVDDPEAQEPRRLSQVAANGFVPLVPLALLAGSAIGQPVAVAAVVGALAAATGDTWSSEIGRRARRPPVSLRLGRRVTSGTSGAVSLLGSAAALAGGALIGAVGWLAFDRPALVAIGALTGLAGSTLDSVVGAWLQGELRCRVCGERVETLEHCATRAEPVRGLRWIRNDAVNLIANLSGMVCGPALAAGLARIWS